MALMTANPFKHPKTGVYYYRRGVPEELRHLVGKREEKISLGTKDPVVARRLHAAKAAEVEARWASLAQPPRTMNEHEAHLAAKEHFERYLTAHQDNPNQGPWDPSIGERLWTAPSYEKLLTKLSSPGWISTPDFEYAEQLRYETHCRAEADRYLADQGLRLDEQGRVTLEKAIGSALQQAALALRELHTHRPLYFEHFIRSKSRGDRIATSGAVTQPTTSANFLSLVERWVSEKRPTKKTVYSWTRVIEELQRFLGYDEAQQLTADDLLRWKSALIERGLSAKTIRDGKFAPVRAILQVGVDNRQLATNVAERLTITVKTKPGQGRRGFTEDEAKIVLRAASQQNTSFKRWVPWICAYSGARVAEICQLRRKDIVLQEGIWLLTITGDAGPIKTGSSERLVPLHKALLNEGFLKFVNRSKPGPLFTELKPDRFDSRGGTGTKLISRWIRSLGIVDRRISPNHSWRHRFKTLCRRYGVSPDIATALMGHGRRSVADQYGEFPPDALYMEISKIPEIDLGL